MVAVYTSKTGPYLCVILEENTGKAPDSGTHPEHVPRPGGRRLGCGGNRAARLENRWGQCSLRVETAGGGAPVLLRENPLEGCLSPWRGEWIEEGRVKLEPTAGLIPFSGFCET